MMRSPMTSIQNLPGRFLNSRDVALKSFLAEADAAEVEIAHKATRAAALEATSHRPRREFRLAARLYDH